MKKVNENASSGAISVSGIASYAGGVSHNPRKKMSLADQLKKFQVLKEKHGDMKYRTFDEILDDAHKFPYDHPTSNTVNVIGFPSKEAPIGISIYHISVHHNLPIAYVRRGFNQIMKMLRKKTGDFSNFESDISRYVRGKLIGDINAFGDFAKLAGKNDDDSEDITDPLINLEDID